MPDRPRSAWGLPHAQRHTQRTAQQRTQRPTTTAAISMAAKPGPSTAHCPHAQSDEDELKTICRSCPLICAVANVGPAMPLPFQHTLLQRRSNVRLRSPTNGSVTVAIAYLRGSRRALARAKRRGAAQRGTTRGRASAAVRTGARDARCRVVHPHAADVLGALRRRARTARVSRARAARARTPQAQCAKPRAQHRSWCTRRDGTCTRPGRSSSHGRALAPPASRSSSATRVSRQASTSPWRNTTRTPSRSRGRHSGACTNGSRSGVSNARRRPPRAPRARARGRRPPPKCA